MVYINLCRLGPSSVLQVSKPSGLSRTQTYRRLEELQTVGLVSAEKLSYGTFFRALPIDNIEGLLANREAETAAIRRNLGSMGEVLKALAGTSGPKATIQHYYGLGGLKQVNWNLSKADDKFQVFEAAHLSQHLDQAFARRCRDRYIERNLKTYDLTNATSVKANDIEPFDSKNAHYRYISPDVLTISFEMYIYNDVVTLVDYATEKGHAIEIHHSSLNQMMRQLFETMWNMGTDLKIT